MNVFPVKWVNWSPLWCCDPRQPPQQAASDSWLAAFLWQAVIEEGDNGAGLGDTGYPSMGTWTGTSRPLNFQCTSLLITRGFNICSALLKAVSWRMSNSIQERMCMCVCVCGHLENKVPALQLGRTRVPLRLVSIESRQEVGKIQEGTEALWVPVYQARLFSRTRFYCLGFYLLKKIIFPYKSPSSLVCATVSVSFLSLTLKHPEFWPCWIKGSELDSPAQHL